MNMKISIIGAGTLKVLKSDCTLEEKYATHVISYIVHYDKCIIF